MAARDPYPATFRCLTHDDLTQAAMKSLPRGRAWQTHESGPQPGSILHDYWQSAAEVFAFLTQRLCALRLEFWCATHSETHDLWMEEYGLPDACDPFPDLCAKVAAIGGTRCEYYAAIAARAGWSITCLDDELTCGSRLGVGTKVGRMRTGKRRSSELVIVVDLAASPSFSGRHRAPPKVGRFKAGWRLWCPPDIAPLECLLARVVHAEIKITYEVF
ncbi:hypothetical protein LPW26_06135 [Rhodopseudomonas sp. HC1]|uniref:hypothetical protein n=1 Tax=Rhodopseudomonas infernalis TaxID=2897386 RepID=UPI001EE83049|nr:hypothetical protein [Rhodopseudomonas infernalis]MCG6204206.1 hypothetical protein [Rhodopseudomonas infernalis]